MGTFVWKICVERLDTLTWISVQVLKYSTSKELTSYMSLIANKYTLNFNWNRSLKWLHLQNFPFLSRNYPHAKVICWLRSSNLGIDNTLTIMGSLSSWTLMLLLQPYKTEGVGFDCRRRHELLLLMVTVSSLKTCQWPASSVEGS